MRHFDKDAFIEALKNAATANDVKFREYSGRGMCGAYCVAIAGDKYACDQAVMDAAQSVDFKFPVPRRDSMGLGAVYYWPGINQ